MRIEFYGVRGSMPAAGPAYIKYGGNTACVHVQLKDGTDLILDSGTGIVELGHKLVQKDTPIHLLLSHNHWDHIQGFPFFLPAHQSQRRLVITPGLTEPTADKAILEQMSGTYFPLHHTDLKANIKIDTHNEADTWSIGPATISRQRLNHPSAGSAYCIQTPDCKLAYVTDNELYPPYPEATSYQQWIDFIAAADVLIHDAQYTESDMPFKHGWGHSLVEQAIMLAQDAKVKKCVLYSHDLARNDESVDAQLKKMQQIAAERTPEIEIIAAYEGLVLDY
ncbi:MBL fold metallo-hydrolase [Gayadomonas joobiniege]|uniref:MBL fold metallo-hydrolase n=1 Tax=Gayadomonas joobiniege TaxID=1234606 RepID=UPI00035F5F9B|nr:MBL fold metallo-hydrolase [Gayadomonas joobiniege]